MYKKTETQDLDIPKDDFECWERYPKHHWVYDLSRLLDAQSIDWRPYATSGYPIMAKNMSLSINPAYIYLKEELRKEILTEVFIVKGEIKHLHYIDKRTNLDIQEQQGNIELRISAFVSMHFQKFTGVICVDSDGTHIASIQLRPYSELGQSTNADILKLFKRIYKKTDTILNSILESVTNSVVA